MELFSSYVNIAAQSIAIGAGAGCVVIITGGVIRFIFRLLEKGGA